MGCAKEVAMKTQQWSNVFDYIRNLKNHVNLLVLLVINIMVTRPVLKVFELHSTSQVLSNHRSSS